jgi:hypothetical protein
LAGTGELLYAAHRNFEADEQVRLADRKASPSVLSAHSRTTTLPKEAFNG